MMSNAAGLSCTFLYTHALSKYNSFDVSTLFKVHTFLLPKRLREQNEIFNSIDYNQRNLLNIKILAEKKKRGDTMQ